MRISANKTIFVSILSILFLPTLAFASAGKLTELEITHRMMFLVIQLGVILFATRIGGIIFEKIHMPAVLGELVAGMIIGPYALGRTPIIGFPHGIFPLYGDFPISPELYALSAVAAVILLFMVGLETDLSLLLRYSFAGIIVGIGGVIASFILGAATLVIFSPMLLGKQLSFFSPVSLFGGIVATATSVGITARILSEKRKLDSPEGVTILSAAVIDDVIGIILLAVVMGIVASTKKHGYVDWEHILLISVRAIVVWLVATVIGLLGARKISFLLKLFRQRTAIAIMALGLALILSGLFEQVGLAMIIGAYVMGLTLSNTDIKHAIRERLDDIYEFLVPVFFCVTGMQLNVVSLLSPKLLIFAGVYAFVGILSKLIGCGLPALIANFNLRGALRVGFGMAPRGEVGLIIAGIALSTGFITHDLFAAMVIMVAANTLIAPPALVLLFRSPESGVRHPERLTPAGETKLNFEFPSHQMADFFLGKLREIFESEGFFVHNISRTQRLYECRKDETVFDFQCTGTSLIFTCHETDVPFIKTAMYEAFAAFENTINQLHKPLDANTIGTLIDEKPTHITQGISLKHYITPKLIEPNLKGNTKEQIVSELVELLVKNGLLRKKDAPQAIKAVLEREESMSTGMQYGIAIPHGKTDVVDDLVCAVGIKTEGIDFNAMDGKPSKIFFLTLSPTDKPAPHVHFMATVSQVLDKQGREKILTCKTAEEIYKVLTRQSNMS